MPALIQFNKVNQNIEFLALGAVEFGFEDFVDTSQSGFIVFLGTNWLYVDHFYTSSASIRAILLALFSRQGREAVVILQLDFRPIKTFSQKPDT